MRIIKGISALVAVAAIIVGVPAFLLLTIGNPLPGLTELPSLLSRPDYDGTVLFGTIVPILAWLGWAWLTIGILIEALAAARNVQIRRIGLFSPSQGLGSILIGAIVAMGGAVGAIAPANAATPAPQPSSVVQPHTTTSSPAHAAETTATQAGHTRASTQALKVTVKPGDTLWSLAERHLGDGAKFKQIAELNYGHPQPGGGHLTHTHTLEPGWELTLPANATQAPQTHTVQSGETLSSIAKTYLGDADAYPKLLALNPTITNPDQITVGQVLRLPAPITTTAAHTRQQTTTEKKSEPKKPTPTASAGKASKASAADSSAAVEGASAVAKDAVVAGQAVSAAGEAAGAVQAPVEHAGGGASPSAPGSAAAEEDSDGPSVTLRTVGGIGGVLAAGLLALFARRRWHRRRTRKPGAPTPATSHDADLVEARLKDVETPVTSEDIDTTLRYLATWSQQHATELPDLFCVRATDTGSELNLYLVGPATLPVPFTKVTDDNTVWAIIPSELPSTGEGGTPSAPYPGLVTLGHDDNHGQILLDLEQLSTLNITGSQHRATATMNALAVELGVSPWAEDLTVSLVGFLEDLPAALGTGRIRHYEDLDSLLGHLRPYAAGIESDLASAGLQSPRAARVASEEAEAWPPEIVLIGEPGTGWGSPP
jgi:LysM repeat protein